MIVERDTVVYLNYRLANAAGEVIEDEWDSEPIAVLQGRGNIIVGLEVRLRGMARVTSLMFWYKRLRLMEIIRKDKRSEYRRNILRMQKGCVQGC